MVFSIENQRDLPKRIKIKKHKYRILTDFRDWITFELIINNPEIDNITKQLTILDTMIIDSILPEDIEGVINALFSFYFLNKERKKVETKEKESEVPYSYEQDWNYIYAAFMQQYSIDLFQTKMHWFKFKSLFDNLNDTTQFMKIVGYRTINISNIKDKEMRQMYINLKNQYALSGIKKVRKSAKEIEAQVLANMKGGEANDK